MQIPATQINAGYGVAPIATQTLGGAAASIDFTSLSQAYAHLMIEFSLRSDTAAKSTAIWMRLNNESGGSAYLSAAGIDSKAVLGLMPAATNTDTVAASRGQVWLPYYTQTGVAHTLSGTYGGRINDGGTGADFGAPAIGAVCGVSSAFGAINRLTVLPAAGNLIAGSRVTVYGFGA
jgi:hypothetical protein